MPASLPTVVAVGGTSLKLKANGTRESESVWNDSGRPSHQEELKQYAATGGGCSTLFTAPSWQQNVQVITECEFEYGTSTGYGSSAPCATLPGSGSSPVAVSALLTTGLIAKPNTTSGSPPPTQPAQPKAKT